MRADMAKVIVERPRRWYPPVRRGRRRQLWKVDPDSAPSWEAVSRGRGSKELNENLRPLYRFLESSVGRPWNAVFSELSEHVSPRTTMQKHVLDHVRQYVAMNASIENGIVYSQTRYYTRPLHSGDLYVCPATGLLKRARVRKRAAELCDRTVWRVSREHELRRIGAAWYEVRFARVPSLLKRTWRAFDIVLERELLATNVHQILRGAYGRDDHYAASKHVVSGRELRALFEEARRFRPRRFDGIPWGFIALR